MTHQAQAFLYPRDQIKAGILHFGVGNFHRAHFEYYTHHVLQDSSQHQWGICGAMIMPQDAALYDALQGQQREYSLTICGRDGHNEIEWIGSLVELLLQEKDAEVILQKIANPNIRIISMTITEGGYNLNQVTGEFDFSNEIVKHDLTHPQTPKSIFGIIAEGLRRRQAAGAGPVTILSCDNLQHNGKVCKKVFTAFIAAQDPELLTWVVQNTSFPNSMVDRITPATTPADRERINKTLDRPDAAPVYCEDYIQWVLEDNFVAGRPDWDKAGVEFTHDVEPYEKMKLRLLNAAHSLLSYPSFLSGYRKVDAAMHDTRIVKYVRDFMNLDATPTVPAPQGVDLESYKRILIERFANSSVSDQVARLCGDGASKFAVYIMPILRDMLAQKMDTTRLALLIASYRHYLKYTTDDKGELFALFEPALTSNDKELLLRPNPLDFLNASPFSSIPLQEHDNFCQQYEHFVKLIEKKGCMKTLESIL